MRIGLEYVRDISVQVDEKYQPRVGGALPAAHFDNMLRVAEEAGGVRSGTFFTNESLTKCGCVWGAAMVADRVAGDWIMDDVSPKGCLVALARLGIGPWEFDSAIRAVRDSVDARKRVPLAAVFAHLGITRGAE